MKREKRWLKIGFLAWAVAIGLACVFIWLNVKRSGPFLAQCSGTGYDLEYYWADYRGWPLHFQQFEDEWVHTGQHQNHVEAGLSSPFNVPKRGTKELRFEDLWWGRYSPDTSWFCIALAVNIMIGIHAMAAGAVLTECLVRRLRGTHISFLGTLWGSIVGARYPVTQRVAFFFTGCAETVQAQTAEQIRTGPDIFPSRGR